MQSSGSQRIGDNRVVRAKLFKRIAWAEWKAESAETRSEFIAEAGDVNVEPANKLDMKGERNRKRREAYRINKSMPSPPPRKKSKSVESIDDDNVEGLLAAAPELALATPSKSKKEDSDTPEKHLRVKDLYSEAGKQLLSEFRSISSSTDSESMAVKSFLRRALSSSKPEVKALCPRIMRQRGTVAKRGRRVGSYKQSDQDLKDLIRPYCAPCSTFSKKTRKTS